MTKAEKRAIRSEAWRKACAEARDRETQERIYRGIVDQIIPPKSQRRRRDRPASVEPVATPAADPVTVERTIYTDAPPSWYGVKLYDWGAKGLRVEGNCKLSVPGGRPRKTFDKAWITDLRAVPSGHAALTRKLKAITPEVWPVHTRRGKYWRLSYYLTSDRAYQQAVDSIPAPVAEPESPETSAPSDVEAFGAWLESGGWNHVRITSNDAAQLALGGMVAAPPAEALDFVVYNEGGENALVRIIDGPDAYAIEGEELTAWAETFGPGFAGVLVWRDEADDWQAVTVSDFDTIGTAGARAFGEVAATMDAIPV